MRRTKSSFKLEVAPASTPVGGRRSSFRLALFLIFSRFVALVFAGTVATGCTSVGKRDTASVSEAAPAASTPSPAPSQAKRPGGYYKDDGPEAVIPPNLEAVPDAVPREEPLHRFANRPYEVFGQSYVPVGAGKPYKARGLASWYGKKFHGLKTASGEIYDMYGMTAAHPTLPIPSYVRVTNLKNDRSVVVRINDRGPFHPNRIIDLSYTAAHKLGYINDGHTMVEVERIQPSDPFGKPPVQAQATPLPPGIVLASATRSETPSNDIYLQLGAFATQQNADAFHNEVNARIKDFPRAAQVKEIGGLYRVHIGPYFDEAQARHDANELKSRYNLSPVLAIR